MKKRGKIFLALLLGGVLAAPTLVSFADETDEAREIELYLKPDVAVVFNNEYMEFSDEQGEEVYPIIYEGSTYLPVRAVSSLMKAPIEWLAGSKTILIGYTLSNLDGTYDRDMPSYARTTEERKEGRESVVRGFIRPDVKIFYNFEEQSFQNVALERVYPINYNGSTYLPLRAIAGLMDAKISWEDTRKRVVITKQEPEARIIRVESQTISETLDGMEKLYSAVTAKILDFASIDEDELQKTAEGISEDYEEMRRKNWNASKAFADSENYTKDEKDAARKTQIFGKNCEQYILMVENIAYMAVQGQDYSVLSDSFYDVMLLTQTSLEEAREAVSCL